MTTILIVDDEPHIVSFVQRGLQSAGYDTAVADDGETALEITRAQEIDLVLLDVGLPGIDGFEVLRQLRGDGDPVPVIMLTARTSTKDTVEGLDAGADDYVGKPFTFEELLARVRSRLRERTPRNAYTLTDGEVTLDLLTRNVTAQGRNVDLSAREFALAEQFLRHRQTPLSRQELLHSVWGMDFDPGSNIVDVYVRYLRGKLGTSRISTVRGVGYRWN